ncbi:oxygenase MpaB family protein [Streptomyces sp. NPDC089915]|uniref:oxygenase MpaB family protein n=1 Tax=Streptomyces sp. NPDC089915 TaxID=3155186 RepID=UPI0034265F76
MGRHTRLRHIQTLDPDTDYEEIFQLVTRYEFPWDYNQGYSVAFVTDFLIPSITQALADGGEFLRHPQKRFDDTMLFPYEACRAGLESPHGRATLRALNKIHAHYEIANEDYLYILTSHTVWPIRWINTYGWRGLTDTEIRALVNTNRRMGRLMGIKDIPATHAEFDAYVRRAEAERAAPHPANRTMARCALDIIAGMCPAPTRRLVLSAVTSMIEPANRRILGLEDPPAWLTPVTHTALRARGRLVRALPPRPDDKPFHRTPPSYPAGWTIDHLGPIEYGPYAQHDFPRRKDAP